MGLKPHLNQVSIYAMAASQKEKPCTCLVMKCKALLFNYLFRAGMLRMTKGASLHTKGFFEVGFGK